MNVGTLFTKAARSFPERLAIAYGEKEWTYRQANERVNRLANALRGLGIQKGSHVAILLHNCPEFLETLFACFKAGIGAVPINFRLHPKECSFIIDNSEAQAVVLGEDFRDSLYALKGEMPRVKHYISIIEPLEGMLRYEDLIYGRFSSFTDEGVESATT
jgi:acyl-CoA synthetase (AMP-forming)/AMP-acid ligase II